MEPRPYAYWTNPEQSNPLGWLPPQTYGVPICAWATATALAVEPLPWPAAVEVTGVAVTAAVLWTVVLLCGVATASVAAYVACVGAAVLVVAAKVVTLLVFAALVWATLIVAEAALTWVGAWDTTLTWAAVVLLSEAADTTVVGCAWSATLLAFVVETAGVVGVAVVSVVSTAAWLAVVLSVAVGAATVAAAEAVLIAEDGITNCWPT